MVRDSPLGVAAPKVKMGCMPFTGAGTVSVSPEGLRASSSSPRR